MITKGKNYLLVTRKNKCKCTLVLLQQKYLTADWSIRIQSSREPCLLLVKTALTILMTLKTVLKVVYLNICRTIVKQSIQYIPAPSHLTKTYRFMHLQWCFVSVHWCAIWLNSTNINRFKHYCFMPADNAIVIKQTLRFIVTHGNSSITDKLIWPPAAKQSQGSLFKLSSINSLARAKCWIIQCLGTIFVRSLVREGKI